MRQVQKLKSDFLALPTQKLSDVFGVNNVLRKRGCILPKNNLELKHVKELLTSQKAIFLLMLEAVRNEKIIDKFLDATEVALHMAGDQFQKNQVETTLAMNRGTLDLQPQPHKLISQRKWACSRLLMTTNWQTNLRLLRHSKFSPSNFLLFGCIGSLRFLKEQCS
ncbi:hypothetical protein Cgig2_025112 [Carnegiea gigantea]|uniref:Uncharacterized protein n=1 Tax=Carnegiea gigantea TaxID=171969 RepID=A0A9Q1JNT9_9CARY|nr:hypothetical protein Cgig2_025112 [Carnegiea gigantea]